MSSLFGDAISHVCCANLLPNRSTRGHFDRFATGWTRGRNRTATSPSDRTDVTRPVVAEKLNSPDVQKNADGSVDVYFGPSAL